MNNDSFQIREYGRTELAQLYSPDITSQAAWRKLKEWIEHNSSLYDELCALGYDGSSARLRPVWCLESFITSVAHNYTTHTINAR